MPNSLSILGEFFPSQKAAEVPYRELLNSGDTDQLITDGDNVKRLEVLFFARPEKVAELKGRKITHWGRVGNTETICFAAFLEDGSHVHFSIKKSVRALAQKCGDERT